MARSTRQEPDGLIYRLSILVALLALAVPAQARDAHSTRHVLIVHRAPCTTHACAVRRAQDRCHATREQVACVITARAHRRAEAVAHAAAIPSCLTIPCYQAYLVSAIGPVEARCAENVIAGEDAIYDPTLMYGGGHGWAGPGDDRAGGIPQAKPMEKMAAAGADWATNGVTQLRWMVTIYFGPSGAYPDACAAWAHKQAYGWY